ncbi:MAG: ATP-binding cassette domain-containing protein [Nocardioidaceae bacterium]
MGLPKSRVDEMLEVVGLTPTETKRRVGAYSLGMRQRLGIAHALLGKPEVLVLDEPANGLDPAGIRWMRGLLQGFAEDGGTVLLSSHLIHEIEIIADELVVIGRGKILAQGSKQQMLTQAGTKVRALDPAALAATLTDAGLAFTATSDGALIVDAPTERVGAAALAGHVVLTELRSGGSGLEELFLELTADDAREEVPA